MEELEARRRVLIARCELQRTDMALRARAFRNDPLRALAARLLGAAPGEAAGATAFKHPLTWVLTLAGLVFLRQPRQALSVLGWVRTAAEMAAKASLAMRLIGQVRGAFARPRTRRSGS
jgi:hypothetical protein